MPPLRYAFSDAIILLHLLLMNIATCCWALLKAAYAIIITLRFHYYAITPILLHWRLRFSPCHMIRHYWHDARWYIIVTPMPWCHAFAFIIALRHCRRHWRLRHYAYWWCRLASHCWEPLSLAIAITPTHGNTPLSHIFAAVIISRADTYVVSH